MIPPNIALLAWPLVAIWLFSRLPFERAIIWSVVASFLILPSSYAVDLPGLPPMNKQSLPNLTLLAIILLTPGVRFRLLPEHLASKVAIGLLLVSGTLTVLTNQDPIWIAERVLPGMVIYDALSHTVRQFLIIVPFLIGWQYLRTPDAHRELLKALFVAGLAYSLLMLFEVRMSPQLHKTFYGYFPHGFKQQIRWGGFRPVVFMRHGLWVAFFAMTIFVVALALWRDSKETGGRAGQDPRYLLAAGYLGVVLVLCKSLGSLLYGLFLLPVLLLLSTKKQVYIAAMLAAISLSYPILRGVELVPTGQILEWARSIDEQRYNSLNIRFTNEDRLLQHAENRPFFGWGLWGRNRVFDADTGRDISITDGYWVIVIGVSGWVGYLAFFGLLGIPVLRLWHGMWRSGVPPPQVTCALALLVAINMVEVLPNSTLPPWTWLIAGAVLGYARQEKMDEATADQPIAELRTRKTVI